MRFAPKTPFFLSLSVLTLAACGGSGGGTDITQDPYFIGTDDESASSTGLPFAAEGAVSSTSATDITIPLLTADVGATRVPANERVSSTTFSADISFFLGGSNNFDIDIAGETVTIADGSGVLSDGRTVQALRLVETVGGPVVAFAVSDAGQYESISTFGFRNETPPSIIDDRMGSADFVGQLQLLSVAYVDDEFIDIGGQLDAPVSINVDFSDRTLSGDIGEMPLGIGASTLSGKLNGTDIAGNGAIGDITWTCANGATCSDTADFGLVFSRAGRLGMIGLTSIDADITFDNDTEASIVGVGGFVTLED